MLSFARLRGATIVLKRGVSYLPRKANYYEILGVEPNATEEEIRKAFVKKSHELHPDRKMLSKDKRMGWRRTSDTESFMEVKEAYDCLRKSASRAQYDSRLVNAAGHLHEASHMKFNQGTIVDLNRDRDEAHLGPRSHIPMSGHFRDLEQEYYKEKHRNRMLVMAAGLAFILVLANIGYVSYLRRNRFAHLAPNHDADKRF